MTRELVLLPKAGKDAREAYSWYEEQRLGLGEEFLGCLESAFYHVVNFPQIYPERFDDFRRILIRRFPYAIYFVHDEDRVIIYGIFHGAQDPSKIAARLKES